LEGLFYLGVRKLACRHGQIKKTGDATAAQRLLGTPLAGVPGSISLIQSWAPTTTRRPYRYVPVRLSAFFIDTGGLSLRRTIYIMPDYNKQL
jgi:hypothetical protein